MLGTMGTSAYKNVQDFRDHKDYLGYMYGGTHGFISRSTIADDQYSQRLYTSDWLINRNRYFGVDNVYTSMNSFCKQSRKTEYLKKLNALYVDLDCYKIGISQEKALYILEQEYFGRRIPVPTFVINSGRGLYLIWKIYEDRNALPRWTSVQRHFFEVCGEFNADINALDASRILRVPFTKHSGNGATVSIMRFTDVKYTLHEIIREYDVKPHGAATKKGKRAVTFPYGQATAKQREAARLIAEKHGLDLPDFESYEDTFKFIETHYKITHREGMGSLRRYRNTSFNHKPYLYGRCQDLTRLFAMRRGADCRREVGLFLYRLWLCELTHDYEYALRETLHFNELLDRPFPAEYVAKSTESAERAVRRGRTYKYGMKKLIKVLAITDEELTHLHHVHTATKSGGERKKERNRKDYLKRLEMAGKTVKKDAVRTRRERIAAMIAAGEAKECICDALEISGRTYDRDMKAIQAESVTERVKAVLSATPDNTAVGINAAVKAVEGLLCASKRVFSARSDLMTKIKPLYYSEKPLAFLNGCKVYYEQLSLFDFFKDVIRLTPLATGGFCTGGLSPLRPATCGVVGGLASADSS